MKKHLLVIILTTFSAVALNAQQLAFPGAEGYGKYTIGGRGGKVYEVTNLNDNGPGSLRAAVEASGPRTVVFRVSGTIILEKELKVSNPYITIAGQTAPGDGITLRRYPLVIGANQVIVRYIRVRFGNESGDDDDAVSSRFTKNLILDHVSASWSVDETMSVYHCDSVTIQWCIIAESMYNSNHIKGAHGFGGIWGSNNSSYHHNLIAHNSSRNPRMASGTGNFDYRNNVIYNWGYNSCYGGEQQQVGDPDHAFTTINMVANYYKPGPATEPGQVTYRIANPSYRDVKSDYGKWYIAGNVMVGNDSVTANNWNGGVQPSGGLGDTMYVKLNEPWPSMPINQQTPEDAYNSVLEQAGCSFPARDVVDARILHDVRNGDATYEGVTYKQTKTVPDITKICGIIDSQTDVGGWPELKSTPAPNDTDHDGMPDDWESSHGLNPNDPTDGNAYTLDSSYTNLEIYLNSIIEVLPNVPVTGVTVSPKTITVIQNDSTQLTTTVAPANASNKTVLWTSGNSAIATVDAAGIVRGISPGKVNIIATTQDASFNNASAVTVVYVPVTGISLPEKDTIKPQESIQLTDTLTPSDASIKEVSWSSDNASVATVSSTGLVTAVAEGTAHITVVTKDGGFSATTEITVYQPPLPTPLIKLGFNEDSGSTVSNAGSVSTTLTKSDIPVWSNNVPVHGGSSSVDFGTIPGDNYVESDSIINELTGLSNFTVTGWVNCRDSKTGSGGNRIVSWIKNGGQGVDIVYISNGSLKVGINEWPDHSVAQSNSGKIPTDGNASDSNWRFFAVTYDSSLSSLKFYFGDNNTPASLDKEIEYNMGAVGTDIGKLAIGHFNEESRRTSRLDRMFKGLIDQVEIYGSDLSQTELRSVQNLFPFMQTKNIEVALDENGHASITPAQVDSGSVSYNGNLSLSLDKSEFDCSNAGTSVTVTLAGIDEKGYTSSAKAQVGVIDTLKPVLTRPSNQFFCFSNAGTYTVPSLTATDNCGIAGVTYSVTGVTSRSGTGADASGVFNAGLSIIAWTVTDIHGNVSTDSTNITVNPSLSVGIPDVFAVSKGADANTIYVGYGPSSLSIQAIASGGTAPYTYSWNTTPVKTTQTVNVNQAGNYTVITTDDRGCNATASIVTKMVNVRCGNENDKVIVCHNSDKTLCISYDDVIDLLNHGDKLGVCSETTNSSITERLADVNSASIVIYPNPLVNSFKINVNKLQPNATIQLYNEYGVLVASYSLTKLSQEISLKGMASGVYFVNVKNGDSFLTQKMIKL